ncbi:MAG: hypothetical protein AAF990_11430 [Bacteroidota bacterium]
MTQVQIQALTDEEFQEVEKTYKKHQRDSAGKILFSVLFVFVGPLLPNRKNPDDIDPATYLFSIVILSLIIVFTYLLDHLRLGANLRKDLKYKQKKGVHLLVSKKERFFTNNTFFALDEAADERIEIQEEEYHQLKKGDQIVVWTTEHADIDLYYEIIPS